MSKHIADQVQTLMADRVMKGVEKVVRKYPDLSNEDLAVKVMQEVWGISTQEPKEKDEVFLGNVVMVQKCREMLAG